MSFCGNFFSHFRLQKKAVSKLLRGLIRLQLIIDHNTQAKRKIDRFLLVQPAQRIDAIAIMTMTMMMMMQEAGNLSASHEDKTRQNNTNYSLSEQ